MIKNLKTLVKRVSKNDICDLLNLTTKESFFTFNFKFYIQADDVVMESLPDAILVKIFLSYNEEN